MKVQIKHALIAVLVFCGASSLLAEQPNTTEIREPQVIRVVRPVVPTDFVRAGIQGEVKVTFRIDEEGRPQDVQVAAASHPEFAHSVTNALRSWRFEAPEDATRVYGMPFLFQ